MKKIISLLLVLVMIASLLGAAVMAANDTVLPFTDVKETDWFYPFVKDLYSQKVIAGQTETTFDPSGDLTYAAALKLLVVGVTGKDPGNSTSGHWAAKYLDEAVKAEWTDVTADKLDAPITRVTFCEIAAKAKNLTEQPAQNKFTDTANAAVLALVKAGVISGMSETEFSPNTVLTRAQIAKIICNLRQITDAEKDAEHMKNTTPPEHKLPTVEELKSRGEVYYVGKTRQHKSFASLLLDLTGNEKQKTIFIDEGEYDIFAEYRAEVEKGRIAVPPDTINNSTYMEAGDKWYNAFVPNNTVIYGLGNVTLRFTPSKDEITYGESRVWSPLNVFGSVEMYNLNVLVKNGRYCLHNDDHNRYPDSFQYYYNCRFEYQLGDMKTEDKRLGFNSTIGFGINDNSVHFFDNCEIYFNGDGNRGVYYGHDASKGKQSAWIFLKDCHLHASDPTNNRVIRLQTLAKNVSDRPVYVTVQNCKVNGGLQFNMYYAESIQTFDVTYRNTPKMPVSRTNTKGDVVDNYTVKYENG